METAQEHLQTETAVPHSPIRRFYVSNDTDDLDFIRGVTASDAPRIVQLIREAEANPPSEITAPAPQPAPGRWIVSRHCEKFFSKNPDAIRLPIGSDHPTV